MPYAICYNENKLMNKNNRNIKIQIMVVVNLPIFFPATHRRTNEMSINKNKIKKFLNCLFSM